MTSTLQQTKNAVTLKGSATLISEFFNYGINSILYQVINTKSGYMIIYHIW